MLNQDSKSEDSCKTRTLVKFYSGGGARKPNLCALNHSIGNTSKFMHSAVQRGALLLCSLLAGTSQFSVLIRQKKHLTGWDNGP